VHTILKTAAERRGITSLKKKDPLRSHQQISGNDWNLIGRVDRRVPATCEGAIRKELLEREIGRQKERNAIGRTQVVFNSRAY